MITAKRPRRCVEGHYSYLVENDVGGTKTSFENSRYIGDMARGECDVVVIAMLKSFGARWLDPKTESLPRSSNIQPSILL
jgi:hypothetical protein